MQRSWLRGFGLFVGGVLGWFFLLGNQNAPALIAPGEGHFARLTQLTFSGENAEGYWSPDGRELIFQSTRPPWGCDQIFRIAADGRGDPVRVSTGTGLTTCAFYLYPAGERVLFSSTHEANPECPPRPDFSQGYVWRLDPHYEIYTARPDGSDLRRLTFSPGYDAEATVCFRDGTILFTSTRDGDLELYTMQPDGSEVRRITHAPGYDGGAFFSPDCSQIVWRASRPQGQELEEYRKLLEQNLVRPGRLELWVADRDGSNARQVTRLGAASFAPYFFPNGKRILFSSNYGDPRGREFELWAIDTTGARLERITFSSGFDGFPMFSPDGSRLAFASNRNQSRPGETNLFVADWMDDSVVFEPGRAEDRYFEDVAILASPEMQGRQAGTEGGERAAAFIEKSFEEIGLRPGRKGGGYRQWFEVVTEVEVDPETALVVDGQPISLEDFQPLGFSASAEASGPLVAAGWGIVAPELEQDDYRGVEVQGRVVLLRRFVPPGEKFQNPDLERRYSDLRFKAFLAKERGAVAVLIADYGSEEPEAELPQLLPERGGDVGIPVVAIRRKLAESLLEKKDATVQLRVALREKRAATANLVGWIAPQHPQTLPGALLVGAHYDHLGWGGPGSLALGEKAIHPGADDNASGVAALLEIARILKSRSAELRRPVWFVAFSAEEMGLLGSTHLVRHPPVGLGIDQLLAMVNLDMVGRLREQKLTVLGAQSAAEWSGLLEKICPQFGVACVGSGDGFGPSDHTPFYAARVPVLHFFTGNHGDYHRPSDLAEKISATGGVLVAEVASQLLLELAAREAPLTYQRVSEPPPGRGDVRSRGASLGTVPDYAGDGLPGVLLAGTRPGGPADRAGLQKGDRIRGLNGQEVRSIEDLMYVLRRLEPGQEVEVVFERGGQTFRVRAILDAPRRVM